MTDEELAPRADRGQSPVLRPADHVRQAGADRDALLGEIDRLRAELAGRRAGEGELGRARCKVLPCRYSEQEWLDDLPEGDVKMLLAHIDYLEGAMIDILNVDGRALREAGAAEERIDSLAYLKHVEQRHRSAGRFGSAKAVASLIHDYDGATLNGRNLPCLLPPQEQRALLDAERAKVATLRAALERIVEIGQDARPVLAPGIAREALEAAEQ